MTTKSPTFTEKYSAILKVATISVLILLLIIPTAMIRSLITERKERQFDAINEVSSKWGGEQILTGPVLTIPYKTFEVDRLGQKVNMKTHNAFFLPEVLNISGTINPEIRYRGIFQIAVYNSKINFTGKFKSPDFSDIKNENTIILWDESFISFGITDMRGIKETIKFSWNNQNVVCEPGIQIKEMMNSGFTSRVSDLNNESVKSFDFSCDMSLNGSKKINFIPLGKETIVKMKSSWKDPCFDGAFLPDSRTINENGFEASWKVLQFNRNFPQKSYDKDLNFDSSAFGVSLLLPVDMYQITDRSVKYAILFITLTFVVFFFIEVLKKLKVHPIQYILVGLGLCLFYLLLLSLCEQISFGFAYLVASAGIIGLIGGYSRSVFKNNKLSLMLTAVLIVLYGFIYVLIQLQDYALLMGSLGLFMVLAVVMYLSRKINWYAIDATNTNKDEETN